MIRIAVAIGLLGLSAGTAFPQSQTNATETSETVYKSKCAGCHGLDGKGQTAMGRSLHLKDLASPDVRDKSNAELFDIIERGQGKMPAFKSRLDKDRIRNLVDYLRQFGRKQ